MLTNLIAKLTGEKIVPLKKDQVKKQYQLILKKKSKLVNQENKLLQLL
jgi:hypothetical protein